MIRMPSRAKTRPTSLGSVAWYPPGGPMVCRVYPRSTGRTYRKLLAESQYVVAAHKLFKKIWEI